MFTIKPIQTKEEQERLCALCGIDYDADCMAYGADVDGVFAGICQFRIDGSDGYIRDLAPTTGTYDFEVMFIMGRQTMNFIDLCGVHTCRCRVGAGRDTLLRGIGFRDTKGDDLYADMTHMFDGEHCASKSGKTVLDGIPESERH